MSDTVAPTLSANVVARPAIAGDLIVTGLDMSDNYYFVAGPTAIGRLLANRLHVI